MHHRDMTCQRRPEERQNEPNTRTQPERRNAQSDTPGPQHTNTNTPPQVVSLKMPAPFSFYVLTKQGQLGQI